MYFFTFLEILYLQMIWVYASFENVLEIYFILTLQIKYKDDVKTIQFKRHFFCHNMFRCQNQNFQFLSQFFLIQKYNEKSLTDVFGLHNIKIGF